MEQDNNFTVLENKAIGRNIALYRRIRGMKATDVAEKLDISESSYSRYERGEGAITVDLLQQVAQVLNVDPLTLMSTHPSNFIENATNSAFGVNYNNNWHTANEEQAKMMMRLMENVIALNERIVSILEKKEK